MSEQFIGCTLSIQVGGGLGFYQGVVKCVNPSNQMITLTKVLHNGRPTNIPEVTINGADIIELKILNMAEASIHESSQNAAVSNSMLPKHSSSLPNLLDQNLQNKQPKNPSPQKKLNYNETLPQTAKPTMESQASTSFTPVPNKPETKMTKKQGENFTTPPTVFKKKSRTSVGEILAYGSQSSEFRNVSDNTNNVGMCNASSVSDFGFQRRTSDVPPPMQNKRLWNKQRKNYRDETTFGTPIDEDLFNTDFDFEKNLALFDKQAVMEEIQSLKPDVVRQADRKSERKYRCDENILASKPQPQRQIVVPAGDAGEVIYSTDSGLLVPSVSTVLRMNLLSMANQNGLTKSRQLEMIGRAATEIIVSVIGGSHRLEPGNSHQAPVVILLCGANTQGAAGVNCGRQLECQGVQTVVVTPPLPQSPTPSLLLSHEIQLYAMTSGKVITEVTSLPSTIDLIVDARFDLHGNLGVSAQSWLRSTNTWGSASRAPVVALDPPSDIVLPITPRILLCPSLPLPYSSDKGKVYLMNLNIPQQVFNSLNIKYTSPFGAKMVIPLHPRE